MAIKDDYKTFCGVAGNKKIKMLNYGLTYFMSGVSFSLLAPFYPQVAEEKGMSLTLIGFVFSVFELMIFITSPFFGYYLKSIGPKFAFVSGIITAGACSILFGTLDMCLPGDAFVVLSFAIRSLEAIGFSSFLNALMAVALAEYPNDVTSVMSCLEGVLLIGLMIGPVIGGVLNSSGGFGLPFYVIGSLVIVQGIFTYFLISTPKQIPSESKSRSFVEAIQNPLVQVGLLCTATGSLGSSCLVSTLAHHLEPFGLSMVFVSLFFVILPGSYLLISPLLGYLSDSKGFHKQLPVIGQFGFGIGFLLLGPSNLLPFIPFKFWTVIIGLVILGLSDCCSVAPPFKCILVGAIEVGFEDNMETYGVISGIVNSVLSFGALLGPILGGVLVQELGNQIAFTIVGFLHIGAGLVAIIIFSVYRIRRSNRQKRNEYTDMTDQ